MPDPNNSSVWPQYKPIDNKKSTDCTCFGEMQDLASKHGNLEYLIRLKEEDFDVYCLTVTGEIGAHHTAEQYAHAYFNTPEARRADELMVWFDNVEPTEQLPYCTACGESIASCSCDDFLGRVVASGIASYFKS